MGEDLIRNLLTVITALGSAGWLGSLLREWRQRRDATSPIARESQHIAGADQSLLVVIRARDELEADNARMRKQAAEDNAQHTAERAEWWRERAQLKGEIDRVEQELRRILAELSQLRAQHGLSS